VLQNSTAKYGNVDMSPKGGQHRAVPQPIEGPRSAANGRSSTAGHKVVESKGSSYPTCHRLKVELHAAT
jgi:hypothetical protein